ncbi:hypothetical protein D9M73_194540 [compost metagenome]
MLVAPKAKGRNGCGMAGVHWGRRPLLALLSEALRRPRRGAPSSLRAVLAAVRVRRAPLRAVWKCSASQSAVLAWPAAWLRSFFTSSPVLMPTGQRWAPRPVAAQVSMPWYW